MKDLPLFGRTWQPDNLPTVYRFIRPLLFRLEPERAHRLTLALLRSVGRLPPLRNLVRRYFAAPAKPVSAFGLTFRNPVGLAAGYDKDALAVQGLAALGFGHLEVGTVTPRPQPGNPKPRVFRLIPDHAVINRMGFPSRGAEFVRRQLATIQCQPDVILGVNLGKNKATPLEEAAHDYLFLMQLFAPLADYLAVNVSSPNTVGLRRLQNRRALGALLAALDARRATLTPQSGRRIPLLVKLSPDLADGALEDALDVMLHTGVDGVIAANTTVDREGVQSPLRGETGGLSGAPLISRSTGMVAKIHRWTGGSLPIVGAGGIMKPDDALAMLDAGATLVQLFTGLVYSGPSLVQGIVRGLKQP